MLSSNAQVPISSPLNAASSSSQLSCELDVPAKLSRARLLDCKCSEQPTVFQVPMHAVEDAHVAQSQGR